MKVQVTRTKQTNKKYIQKWNIYNLGRCKKNYMEK